MLRCYGYGLGWNEGPGPTWMGGGGVGGRGGGGGGGGGRGATTLLNRAMLSRRFPLVSTEVLFSPMSRAIRSLPISSRKSRRHRQNEVCFRWCAIMTARARALFTLVALIADGSGVAWLLSAAVWLKLLFILPRLDGPRAMPPMPPAGGTRTCTRTRGGAMVCQPKPVPAFRNCQNSCVFCDDLRCIQRMPSHC